MKKRAGYLALVVLLGFLFDPRLARAGCWVCLEPAGGEMDCDLSEGESGGTSCEKKCSTTLFGTSYCTCKTIGVCNAGSTGCGGRPCPQSIGPEPRRPRDGDADVERALGQSLLREKIRTERQLDARSTTEGTPVPEDLLAEVRAKSEVAGMLLWGLMSDDALVSGHYEGLLSVTSPSRKGDPARSQVYRYTADIRGDEASLEFVIDLAGHPEVRRISGDLWESGRAGRLEILDPSGWPEILRF